MTRKKVNFTTGWLKLESNNSVYFKDGKEFTCAFSLWEFLILLAKKRKYPADYWPLSIPDIMESPSEIICNVKYPKEVKIDIKIDETADLQYIFWRPDAIFDSAFNGAAFNGGVVLFKSGRIKLRSYELSQPLEKFMLDCGGDKFNFQAWVSWRY